MNEISFDPANGDTVAMVNETNFSSDAVSRAMEEQFPGYKSLAAWARENQQGGIFERDRFASCQGVFPQMRMAKDATDQDDIVGGAVDTTEQLAFSRVEIQCDDFREQDVWNQLNDDLDLVNRMKEVWREFFITSNVTVAKYEGIKKYVPRNTVGMREREKGSRPSRRDYTLNVPLGLTILDPLKVVPFGSFMFNQERLAYVASRSEAAAWDKMSTEEGGMDPIMGQLLQGPLKLGRTEKASIRDEIGSKEDLTYLFALDPRRTFRVTATRSQYERFAAVRMMSVFELLDLKANLRTMDRAMLKGGTNYIMLVRKGDKENLAKPAEMKALAGQFRVMARIPVILSDHRLQIDIIAPSNDKTLSSERHDVLDSRIAQRVFQVLTTGTGGSGAANDDSIKLLRVIARTMEARRNMIRDVFFRQVIKPTFEANPKLEAYPQLVIYPRRISLDFDQNQAQFIQWLRDGGNLSRETTLAEADIDQVEEATRRKRETEIFDEFFPAPEGGGALTDQQKGQMGKQQGGNRNGGGLNATSPMSGPGRGPAKE